MLEDAPGARAVSRWWERGDLSAPLILLALTLLVLVAAALRVYRLDELIVFLGDQGRDVTAVERMIETGQPALLGPGSAFGHFRRGPAYYYLLLPALWATGGEAASAGIFIALMDAVAVAMLFVVGRALAGTSAGLVAALLYACAWVPVQVARGFSNPSLLPVLTLVMLYALWRVVEGRDRFLILAGAAWLVAWQLHDQVWLLLLFVLLTFLFLRPRVRLSTWLLTALCGALLLAPWLWYEAQHGWDNTRAMVEYVRLFLTEPGGEHGIPAAPRRVAETFTILSRAFSDTLGVQIIWAGAVLASGIVLFRDARRSKSAFYLALSALTPLWVLAWPGPIYPLNVAFLLPLPFLVAGYGFARIPPGALRTASAGVLLVLGAWSATWIWTTLSLAQPTRASYDTARAIARVILERTAGNPFVFEMFAAEPTEAYDAPYLYLLKRGGAQLTRDDAAMRVRVFDPAAFDGSAISDPQGASAAPGGMILQDIRVAIFAPPRVVAENLLTKPWNLPAARGSLTEAAEIMLTAPEPGEATNATQRVGLEPGAAYLLTFECRSELVRGDQRVYVQVANGTGTVTDTFPDGGGYVCPSAREWARGAVLVETRAGAARAAVFLRNYGTGTVWFRGVELKRAVLESLDGTFQK